MLWYLLVVVLLLVVIVECFLLLFIYGEECYVGFVQVVGECVLLFQFNMYVVCVGVVVVFVVLEVLVYVEFGVQIVVEVLFVVVFDIVGLQLYEWFQCLCCGQFVVVVLLIIQCCYVLLCVQVVCYVYV